MKKPLSVLLAFCLLIAFCFICPADAEDAPARTLPFEEYEVIEWWNCFYVDLDETLCEPDLVIGTLESSGFASQIDRSDSSWIYIGEKSPDVAYLRVLVRSPYRENNEKLVSLLSQYGPAVLQVYQVFTAVDRYSPDTTDFQSILTLVDLSLCDIDTALERLRSMPLVHEVVDLTPDEIFDDAVREDDPDFERKVASFMVTVDYPFIENGPIVRNALSALDFVIFTCYDVFAGEPDRTYFYGDADLDGKVTAADARLILRFAVLLDRPRDYLPQLLSDMDCDGEVTAADARLALRTAVELEPKNLFYYSAPKYAGLIAGKSVELAAKDGKLLIAASTTGANDVTKCGFTYVKLQKLVGGVWTDVEGCSYTEQFSETNSKVFSAAVAVPKGTYRAVCEHYAEAPYLLVFTHSATFFNVSSAVTL